jgi:exodeoxyribonuclease VII large subunit
MSDLPTAENPWPVSRVSALIGGYFAKFSAVWVDGEISEMNRRSGFTYLTLRDRTDDVSMSVAIPSPVLDKVQPRIDEGMHVVVHASLSWWARRGQLSLRADDIRAVGVGALLARIEQTRQLLLAEGLLDPARKKPIPFLPQRIGLICGSGSDAEHDVVRNARLRWPAAQFEIRHTAVQGPQSPPQVIAALSELAQMSDVDVIVIARGGGSIEDLIGFSDEALCRAVASCSTPVVSAIGHEADHPLLDDVADLRASTPTDAARRIVPDVAEQLTVIDQLRRRAISHVNRLIDHETTQLAAVRSRPCLAAPTRLVDQHAEAMAALRATSTRAVVTHMKHADEQLQQSVARLRALSPAGTLARGYALITDASGALISTTADAISGTKVDVRVSDGHFSATVD